MRSRFAALLAAGTTIVALSMTSASAQPAGYYGTYAPAYGAPPAGPNESVIVTGPRYRADHNYINVPEENVSLSLPVAYGDLDLRTRGGAHEFRSRVRQTASRICRQLIDMYPASPDLNSRCYRDAVANARPNVDAAIQRARYYPGGY